MTEQHRYAVSNPPAAAHDIDAAIDAVCDRVAPFWPLDAMVATNPYLGFVERPFAETAAYQMRILGRRTIMERAWFRSQWDSGRIERPEPHSGASPCTAGRSAYGRRRPAHCRSTWCCCGPPSSDTSAVWRRS